MTDDIAISVKKVSKDFKLPHERADSVKSLFVNPFNKKRHKVETQHALKDISFDIKKGEFFGIVGRNGSGKSTLLKIIAGIYQPNKGQVSVNGRLVPFIELGVGFNPELTGRENTYLNGALLGFSEKEVDKKYKSIVEFAELERFMDQKLKNYSSGMQVRLAFSVATILAESDILLIDEVLAVGDADFQRKCFTYFKKLKKENKTVVFVSHDMAAVREYCDRALLLENNKTQSIGETTYIANEYTKLFFGDDTSNEKSGNSKDNEPYDSSRWGGGQAQTVAVGVKESGDYIEITAKCKVCQDAETIVYGIHIIGADGIEITAMNNRMIQSPDIKNVNEGDIVNIKWKMLNIFNDGEYGVTVTLVGDTGIVYDWLSEAAFFRVKKAERSTTAVVPPVYVSLDKERHQNVKKNN